MYSHKCVVLFTLPFHFQLNPKSQNSAFHFKWFSHFIFDPVMTPQNDPKLITVCLTVHYKCTFLVLMLHIFYIMLSRSCGVIEKWAVMFSWSAWLLFRLWDLRLPGKQSDEIHPRQGRPHILKCNYRKQKGFWFESLHHQVGMPFEKLLQVYALHTLLVMVSETSAFLQSIAQEEHQWFVCDHFACQRCLTSLPIMALLLRVNSHYLPVYL